MKNFLFLLSFLVGFTLNVNSQCTVDTYGQYGTPNPACGAGVYGAWASTTWAYSQEYSIVNVTAGNTYQFQSYQTSNGTSRFTTITTTANVVLASGSTNTATSVTWVATFTGQVRFWTHLNASCGASTVNQTRRVRCSAPAGPPPPPGPCIQPTPYITVNAPTTPTPLTISTCIWAGEYNTINNVVSGQTYEFSSSVVSDWLTLTDASNNSLVFGTSPITWTATFSGTVRLHVSTGSNCGTQNSCRTTTITCTSCVPLTPGPCSNPNPFAISNMPTQINPVVTIFCPGVGQFTDEYSEWLNGVAGITYITSSSITSDWITVRFGSPNGTVVAFGNSPLIWTAPNNGTYYIHVNTNGFCGQDLNCRDVTVQRESPLPVTLLSFTSECDGEIPLLKWTTASEQNSDYFQIERSRDGFGWKEISLVQASGNSNTIKNYQFYDMTSGRFEGYYRLKQVDYDGQFKYFAPIHTNCIQPILDLYSEIFPNPTTGEFFIGIRNNQQETVEILITDNSGRILTNKVIELIDGYVMNGFDLSGYSLGVYHVYVLTSNGKQTHKLVKK